MTLEQQLANAKSNYLAGAIDTATFERAVEDICNGIPNSYGQAPYSQDENAWGEVGARGGE